MIKLCVAHYYHSDLKVTVWLISRDNNTQHSSIIYDSDGLCLTEHTVPFSASSGWSSLDPDWFTKLFNLSERSGRQIFLRSPDRNSVLSAPSFCLSVRSRNSARPLVIFSKFFFPMSRHRNFRLSSWSDDSWSEIASKTALKSTESMSESLMWSLWTRKYFSFTFPSVRVSVSLQFTALLMYQVSIHILVHFYFLFFLLNLTLGLDCAK